MDHFFAFPPPLLCLETRNDNGAGTVRANRNELKGAAGVFQGDGQAVDEGQHELRALGRSGGRKVEKHEGGHTRVHHRKYREGLRATTF